MTTTCFLSSFLVWSLPLTGVLQAVTAIYTFTFLPKRQNYPGYYSDKSALSYAFIVENSFFAGLLCYQWWYYSDPIYRVLKATFIVENIVTFLPYVFRPLWPKTSFRDSLYSEKNKSESNHSFFFIATWITKIFYVWAKHYIGYFLNYVRFLNRVSDDQRYHVYLLLIFSCFATTISLFLHTLKFKKYIGPKTAFLAYMISYMATFYIFVRIAEIFVVNWDLTLLTLVGVVLNFCGRKLEVSYQFILLIGFNAKRYELF